MITFYLPNDYADRIEKSLNVKMRGATKTHRTIQRGYRRGGTGRADRPTGESHASAASSTGWRKKRANTNGEPANRRNYPEQMDTSHPGSDTVPMETDQQRVAPALVIRLANKNRVNIKQHIQFTNHGTNISIKELEMNFELEMN